MEQLRASVLGACMLSAAVGMVSILQPGKRLDRQIRFLISLLFVISLASPFLRMDEPGLPELPAVQGDSAQTAALENTFEEQLLAETKRLGETALRERLAAAGIGCTALEAQVHIDGDGRIYFSEVTAECDQLAAACAVLQEALGEEVSIHVTEVLS